MISQEAAARLMFAHAKAVATSLIAQDSVTPASIKIRIKQADAAEKAFAELVATLVEDENA
jgi:hypothetical protein